MKILIGVGDIILALGLLLMFLITQLGLTFYFPLSIFYMWLGIRIFSKIISIKKYCTVGIPLHLLAGFSVWSMGSPEVPGYFRIDFEGQMQFLIFTIFLPFFVNLIYIFFSNRNNNIC